MADRFVLTLVNNRVVGKSDFDIQENGAVFLNDMGRPDFFEALADSQTRDTDPSIFAGKTFLGIGSLYSSASSGTLSPGRPGFLSAFFVEVRF